MAKLSLSILTMFVAAGLTVGCTQSPQAKAARFIKAGKAQFEKKDYSRAVLQFRNAVQATPADPEAYYQLGLAYMGTNDIKTAVMCFRKAADLNPKHTGAQLMLAEIMTVSSKEDLLQDAAKRAGDVLASTPDNVDALNTIATAELRLGKQQDGEKNPQEGVEKAPAKPRAPLPPGQGKLTQKEGKGGGGSPKS